MKFRAEKSAVVDVAAVSAGHPLRSAVDQFEPGEVGVIQMRNVDPETGVDWGAVSRVELPPSRRIDFLRAADIIFSTRGTRTFAVALDEPPFPTVCSPHFFVLRVKGTAVEPRFLAWQINQTSAQDYLQREATGSHILNIRREVIEQLQLAIPPLERQRAIVAFAEAAIQEKHRLAALIANRQSQIDALAWGLSDDFKEQS